MPISRSEAVQRARAWLGTPYRLGGRLRGAGCDCCTLLAEYLIEINAASPEDLKRLGYYSADWFCHTSEQRYLAALRKFGTLVALTVCRPGKLIEPGSIVLFKCVRSRVFNHGAIVTGWPMGIHAEQAGVKEVDLTRHRLTSFLPMAIVNPWGEA